MTRFAIAIAWVVACTGGTLGPSAGDGDRFGQPDDQVGEAPVPACPNDPDCGLGAEECAECPDYWVCEQIEEDREKARTAAELREEDYQLAYAIDILKGLSALGPNE